MSLKILDTVTLSLLERKDLLVLRRFLAVPPSEIAVTVINIEEQMTGWQIYLRRAKTDKELAVAYEKLGLRFGFCLECGFLAFPRLPLPATKRFRR